MAGSMFFAGFVIGVVIGLVAGAPCVVWLWIQFIRGSRF